MFLDILDTNANCSGLIQQQLGKKINSFSIMEALKWEKFTYLSYFKLSVILK